PKYAIDAKNLVIGFAQDIQQKYHIRILPGQPTAPETKPGAEPTEKAAPENKSKSSESTKPREKKSSVPKGDETDDDTALTEKSTDGSIPATEFEKEYDLQRLFSGDLGGWL